MKFIDKYNCILCKYNKYNKDGGSCLNHLKRDEYGLSNIEEIGSDLVFTNTVCGSPSILIRNISIAS